MAFGDERQGHRDHELVIIEVEEMLVDKDDCDAILVSTSEQEKGVWIPRSLIENEEHNQAGELIQFEIPEWLAIDRGLV